MMSNAKSVKRKHDLPNEATMNDSSLLPNKIFITEDKMANALKSLNIGSPGSPSDSHNDTFDDDDDDGGDDKNAQNDTESLGDNGIVFTKELKMNLIQNEEIFNIKKFFLNTSNGADSKQNQNLQVVPWTPSPLFYLSEKSVNENEAHLLETTAPSNASKATKTFYKVEEPQNNVPTAAKHARSLKRKYSHVRKIPIEDVSMDDRNNVSMTNAENTSSYYVVTNEDGEDWPARNLSESPKEACKDDYVVIKDVSNDENDESMII
jgi:hypothetical protein